MPMLYAYVMVEFAHYGYLFVNLGINALKFCKCEAQHMLWQYLSFWPDLSLDMHISVMLIKKNTCNSLSLF